MTPRPPISTLFPYTTLFRSRRSALEHGPAGDRGGRLDRGGLPRRDDGLRDDSRGDRQGRQDRKSTRLNSSHLGISYAVFCLKKKKIQKHKDENNKKARVVQD